MQKQLKKTEFKGHHILKVTGSKSESNRLLILKALYPNIEIENISNSQDTQVLQKALSLNDDVVDIHHAGTAMRFLTAYFGCFTTQPVVLTGSQRMEERPIKILAEALNAIGCRISYQKNEGFPPLIIQPAEVNKNSIELPANISSQYISALMLVAPMLKNGLEIHLTSNITSLPYLKMTQQLMQNLGFNVYFKEKTIQIKPQSNIPKVVFHVESDWSSASYYYSLVALSNNLSLDLFTYKKNSLQGDSNLVELYKNLGVKTTFYDNFIRLEKDRQPPNLEFFEANLNDTPDLAQTIAVTCLGLNMKCHLTGLATLKIKETDRLVALKTEIQKFGAHVDIDDESLRLIPTQELKSSVSVDTYNDHRMAMAFAPLSPKVDLTINDAEVVEKSYPDFWKDFDRLSEK
jgi:3-phosphoshikimate 1-carboxyvinyltransferase